MSSEDTGVLIVGTSKLAPGPLSSFLLRRDLRITIFHEASQVLQKGDVLLGIDGIRVANDGSIPFREGSFKERSSITPC